MKKSTWLERKHKPLWGQRNIDKDGFIHCSTVEFFWRVAPNFNDVSEELVIVCIDESKLSSVVKFEDHDGCGRLYPHVHGLINNDAVIEVLPFLRDEQGRYIKNKEFDQIQDK